MIWDFSWIQDPSAWFGLGTLIVIEIVLGIDNIVFISILASRLPEHQKQKAFSLGLSLALLMRLGLLCTIAWIVTLTKPFLEIMGHSFSVRDGILLVGGLFLLFKGTLELHERLEGPSTHAGGTVRDGIFWQVIVQILVLDAVFSLDSVITSVGMVKELPVMMIAVCVAMLTMLMAARPLIAFVERHPSVIVLCLGFLLMIGLSLIMDGFGLHVPKGYLYAAIAFSLLVETFNQWILRNRRKQITPRNFRASAAEAVLGLLSGSTGSAGASQLDIAALVSDAKHEAVFAPEECALVARVIRLGGRTVRYVMTPRRKMYCLTEGANREEILRLAAAAPYACIPVQQATKDEVSGAVHLGELLAALESHTPFNLLHMVRPMPTVLEHAPLQNLLDTFRSHPAPLVLVRDEYGSVVGMVTPEDLLHAIAGHMGESLTNAEGLRQEDGSWCLPGCLSVDSVERLLGLKTPPETNAATLAGLILEQRGHIPHVDETWICDGWQWTVLRMDGLRIESVRVAPWSARDGEKAPVPARTSGTTELEQPAKGKR